MRNPKVYELSKDYSVEQCAPDRTNRRFRIFKHLGRVQKSWELNQPSNLYPISWEIHPTDICNLKCPFCAYRDLRGKQYISEIKLNEIIEEISSFKETKSVVFSGGGEPTLHKGFANCVSHLVSKKIDTGVITNGLFKSKNVLEALSKCKWVRISLNAENYENYRKYTGGNEKSFDTVKENIIDLVKLKSSNPKLIIGLSIVIQSQTINEIIETIKLASKLRVDYLMFRADVEQLKFDTSYYIDNSFRIYDNEEELGMITNYCVFLKDIFNQGQSKNYIKCPSVYDGLIGLISAKGNVLPCIPKYVNCQEELSISFGNINKNSIEEIWKSNLREKQVCEINSTKCPKCRHHNMNEILLRYFNGEFGLQECDDPHFNFM